MDNRIRKKYFSFKELRLSIAQMVLWALLTIAFFTYLTLEIGEKIGRTPFYFLIVLIGYAVIVVVLTFIFTHRLIGPFERLKTELRIILSGNYQRRLSIRTKDDIYIRSFISEVDKLLDSLEKMHISRENFSNSIHAELTGIKSLLDNNEVSKEEIKVAIASFNENVESFLNDHISH